MVLAKTILALSVSLASNVIALSVSSISQCPALAARTTAATGVTDLRIDDIKMVAGLGDSIMAGFAMMGVDYEGTGILNLSSVTEYRGHSYAIGADSNAITLPNFIKRYNPKVQGGSILTHTASLCYGLLCGFPLTAYRPLRDNLNAAQSGGLAMNLDLELDYLIPRMKTYSLTSSYSNDWKMISIQIGSNDQCAACSGLFDNNVTPEAYGKYVDAAIQRIKKEIPKTVVNLLGTFKVSGVFPLTNGREDYCALLNGGVNEFECSCASSAENLAKMDALSDGYNAQLKAIAEKYKGTPGGTFAVMYTPAPIDVTSFPIEALSNFDCFHPSIKGHEWIAKTFWNQLFRQGAPVPSTITWQDNLQINCPTDSDRLPVPTQ